MSDGPSDDRLPGAAGGGPGGPNGNLPPEMEGRGRRLAAVAVGLVVVVVLLLLLVGRGRKPPLLPADLEHRASHATRRPEACLTCHARSGPVPVPPGHTGRQDCWSCHDLP